jgi:hypothetical protein
MKAYALAIILTLLACGASAQMHMGGYIGFGMNNHSTPDYFQPHRYLVIFTNGKDTTLKARINPKSPHNLLSYGGLFKKDGALQVFPSETQALVRLDYPQESGDSILDVEYPGLPSDSCWLFKLDTGQINTYSSSAEGAFPYTDTTLLYIQKGGGPILSFTRVRLADMVKDCPRCVRVLSEARVEKAINLYNKRQVMH